MKKLHGAVTEMKVNVHVDGGPSLGLGHLSRMRTVAGELSRLGASVFMQGESVFASKFISVASGVSDLPQVAVIDLPYAADRLISDYLRKGVPTVVLDHLGASVPDVTISVDRKLSRRHGTKHFSGLRYAIIRESLRRKSSRADGAVLVSIGGSDLLGQSSDAADRLLSLGLSVIAVKGLAASSPIGTHATAVEYVKHPENFDDLFARSSFVVVNGGTTLLEALHLGKSAFVLPQTSGEESFARRMALRGLVLGVGLRSLKEPTFSERFWAKGTGPLAVDGLGAPRVARIILNSAHKGADNRIV